MIGAGAFVRLGSAAGGTAAALAAKLASLRLQTKLALFGGALVLAGVGLTGVAGLWLIDRQAERTARVRLAAALEFAVAEYEGLVENARITAEVLAARLSPQFLQPAQGELSQEEVSALVALVRGPRRVEAADSIAIIGRDAAVLVEVVRDRGATRGGQWPGDEAVATALGGTPALGVELFPGGGLRAVAVLPVFGASPAPTTSPGDAHSAESPSPVGAVAVTSFLDDDAAARVKRVTGFDVAFFAGERSLVASSRGADSVGAMALPEQLARAWSVVGAGEEVEAETGGPLQRLLTRFAPLRDTAGDVIGAVAVSAEIDVLGVGRRRTLALFAAAASVVLALTLATDAYASRALSRPLARLVASVRRIGAGDLATPVSGLTAQASEVGRDEVGELAASVEEMRRSLAAAAESQAQLARLKDEYLFSVAHELRSPLAALAASVEVLAESGDDIPAAQRAHFVGIVVRHTAALRGLVDNLLDLGSLRAGRFRVEPLPTSVGAVLEEAVEEVRLLLEARRQRVVRRVASPAPVAMADPRRLRQVLVNLLSNAAKYGPEGEVVEVSAEERAGVVRLVVADRGPGIPAEERARLFDAYFRSESTSRAAPGIGLGLAIVKAIVDAHGGRVGVESAPEAGTCFWVELPAAVGSAV